MTSLKEIVYILKLPCYMVEFPKMAMHISFAYYFVLLPTWQLLPRDPLG